MSDPAQQGQGGDNADSPEKPARRGVTKLAIVAAKFAITALCFWYVSRRVDFAAAVRTLPTLDLRWIGLAAAVALLQIPLLGLRWCEILDALALRNTRITRAAVLGVTSIGAFFAQVLPNVAGDGMRVWYLARLGCPWRNGIISVLIDRGVGIGLMVALAFAILLVPSPLTALGGYRGAVLAIYGALLLAGIFGLLFTPAIAAGLQRWRYAGWLAAAALDARRAIVGPRGLSIVAIGCCVHVLTVLIVWFLGQAQGVALPVFDAAVLFVVMVGIALVPISVGGWGLREFVVVAVMADYGLAPERALLFSVSFGLVLVAGALPGAMVWLLYSVPAAAME